MVALVGYEELQQYTENFTLFQLGVGEYPKRLVGPRVCVLSSRERLKVTCCGCRPSILRGFEDLTQKREFVVGWHELVMEDTVNGVILEALEYLGVDIGEISSGLVAERLYEQVNPGMDMDVLIKLQGKYILSTKFIFTELKDTKTGMKALEHLEKHFKLY